MERPNFWSFHNVMDKIKQLYSEPKNLIVIEFANRTTTAKFVWVEPTCVSIELDAETEFQMITHERTFRMEFDVDETLILYLQYSFGFILNKRKISELVPNPHPWILEVDYSEIN